MTELPSIPTECQSKHFEQVKKHLLEKGLKISSSSVSPPVNGGLSTLKINFDTKTKMSSARSILKKMQDDETQWFIHKVEYGPTRHKQPWTIIHLSVEKFNHIRKKQDSTLGGALHDQRTDSPEPQQPATTDTETEIPQVPQGYDFETEGEALKNFLKQRGLNTSKHFHNVNHASTRPEKKHKWRISCRNEEVTDLIFDILSAFPEYFSNVALPQKQEQNRSVLVDLHYQKIIPTDPKELPFPPELEEKLQKFLKGTSSETEETRAETTTPEEASAQAKIALAAYEAMNEEARTMFKSTIGIIGVEALQTQARELGWLPKSEIISHLNQLGLATVKRNDFFNLSGNAIVLKEVKEL